MKFSRTSHYGTTKTDLFSAGDLLNATKTREKEQSDAKTTLDGFVSLDVDLEELN